MPPPAPRTSSRDPQEEVRSEPIELFCKDFDLGCFEITDPHVCRGGKTVEILGRKYFTLPVLLVCPMADRLV